MRVAVPVCAGETATTIDFAHEILVVDCQQSREIHRSVVALEEVQPENRARRIIRLGVDALICGAISRELARLMQSSGIRLIPLVSGPVEEVLRVFLVGRLDDSMFLLPGCTAEDRRSLIHNCAAREAG